jgi:hypothetical protein
LSRVKSAKKRLLLILGPSFRRNKRSEPLPALERYDGLFFRVARKYLGNAKDVDVIVMKDDLTLVDGTAPLTYEPPRGDRWMIHPLSDDEIKAGKIKNEAFLKRKLLGGKYLEVFFAMGKKYAEALPDLSKFNVKVVFPTSGGPGPKAKALKEWLVRG